MPLSRLVTTEHPNASATTLSFIQRLDTKKTQLDKTIQRQPRQFLKLWIALKNELYALFTPHDQCLLLANASQKPPSEESQKALRHENIVRLVERELDAELKSVWQTASKTIKEFKPENIGKPPLTDLEGNEVRITLLDPASELAQKAMPFLSSDATQRAALYNDRLSVRPFTEKYQQNEWEAAMVTHGGNMVVATKAIEEGACIGLYTGVLISKKEDHYLTDATYIMNAGTFFLIDGDGVLSRLNSCFERDPKTRKFQQATDPAKYNVKMVSLPALVRLSGSNEKVIHLPACVTTRPIAAGEELRVNYNYSPRQVEKMFQA